jgi:HSP20 family molecular chaperone IbpA
MHTIIHPQKSIASRPAPTSGNSDFRDPHYDCMDQTDAVKVVVYVPGVDASGIEITTRGPDLIVTARKSHFVRVNWQALHLESAQRDYQLRLRLGNALDYERLGAEIVDGVLTVLLPKKQPVSFTAPARHRRVA